ncbi:transposase [Micromonospora fulviviridis]|uniref:Transposase n=1 Tax=Micromonospora fulviviridis TaxID=47860 RepID=A0ABV2VWG5_9ACTN
MLRNKTDDLRRALSGRFTTHHGQMIGFHLERLDHLDQMIDQVKQKIGHAGVAGTSRRPAIGPAGLVAPFTAQIQLLSSIPGISDRVATVVISEIGVDMSRFPSGEHLAAWAGLAPSPPAAGAGPGTARATISGKEIILTDPDDEPPRPHDGRSGHDSEAAI